jgi:hypothetical protein
MRLDELPIDILLRVVDYLDSFSCRIRLRHVSSHMYYTVSEQQRFLFSNNNNSDNDERQIELIHMFDTHDQYIHFFTTLVTDMAATTTTVVANKKRNTTLSQLQRSLLTALLNGSTVLMEQYGLSNGRFVTDLFFTSLYIGMKEGLDYTILLRELQKKSWLWNRIDEVSGMFYPRRMLLQLFSQLFIKNRLSGALRSLYESGINFNQIVYRKVAADFNENDWPNIIPPNTTQFTLTQFILWLGDPHSIVTLSGLNLLDDQICIILEQVEEETPICEPPLKKRKLDEPWDMLNSTVSDSTTWTSWND